MWGEEREADGTSYNSSFVLASSSLGTPRKIMKPGVFGNARILAEKNTKIK